MVNMYLCRIIEVGAAWHFLPELFSDGRSVVCLQTSVWSLKSMEISAKQCSPRRYQALDQQTVAYVLFLPVVVYNIKLTEFKDFFSHLLKCNIFKVFIMVAMTLWHYVLIWVVIFNWCLLYSSPLFLCFSVTEMFYFFPNNCIGVMVNEKNWNKI